MGIAQKTETFVSPEDHSWLGKSIGFDQMDPGTLDVDVFLAHGFATGFIPSGVVLGKVTATGLLVPYTDAATYGAGSDTAVGHLGTSKSLGTTAGQKEPCAIFWLGEVIEAKLPASHGLTAAAKADLTHIKYV